MRPLRIVALAACLVVSGCADDIQGEGAFANGGGAGMARAAGMNTASSFATGVPTDAITGHTIRVLAKYQATVRQRQVAEARARKAVAKLQRRAKTHAAPRLSSSSQAAGAPTRQPVESTRKTASAAPAAPAPAEPIPRYIAVDTAPDERQSPKAEKSVMLWDTQAQEIVGNNVYDIQAAPSVGTAARFETYSAEYVGAGL